MDVVFVGHEFINRAIRCQFNDAVGDGVDELVVVAGEENVTFVEFQVVVKRLNAFHVEVVCRRVENLRRARSLSSGCPHP